MTKEHHVASPRRLGRPPKPAGSARSERVVSFVTAGEFRQLEKISLKKRVSLSAVIHSMVVRSLENDAGLRPDIGNVTQQRSEK